MTRVAIKMLLHDRAKYLALVIGIAFSALLISQQSGIFHSVMVTSTRSIREASAADVWVLKPGVESLDESDTMPESYLMRVRSTAGVEWAMPFYQGMAKLRTPLGHNKTVSIVAVDDHSLVGAPVNKMVVGNVKALQKPGAVIMDIPGYMQVFPGQPLQSGLVFELGLKRVEVVGFCQVAPDWTGLPLIYTTRTNTADIMGDPSYPMIAVIVRSQDGYSSKEVAAKITKQTGLSAYPRAELKSRTINWMLQYSGVAENFGITILLGVIIGIIIVGQTFYMFSVENLKQFAALKAIGIGNIRILQMIVLQAVSVGILGYCLGIGVASCFFAIVNPSSGGLRGMFMAPPIFAGTGIFMIIVTHDPRVFGFADRIAYMEDGLIVRTEFSESLAAVAESGSVSDAKQSGQQDLRHQGERQKMAVKGQS
jgi:putative ABC transport system permease protein